MDVLSRRRFPYKLNVFVDLLATSRIICNSSIYLRNVKYTGKRNLSLSASLKSFTGERTRGNYTEGPTPEYVFKRIYEDPKLLLKACRMWGDEFKLWTEEWKQTLSMARLNFSSKGEVNMLYTFEDDTAIEKFRVITDKANNQGYSHANFVRTQDETALFSGYIDCRVPDDGVTKYAGYASIMTRRLLKSFKRFDTYDWRSFTHMVLKVRGDGRTYTLILGCPAKFDVTWQDQFHYPLYTRGGPYWQLVKIPFSNFYFTSKGRIQDQQFAMPLHDCSRIGITLADGVDGPFKLEIEYFGLEYQQHHKSICPYESYAMKNVADL